MRTDATRFCPHCAVRFGRDANCPRCGAEPLSLTKPSGRAAALRRLSRRPKLIRQAIPLNIVSVWLRRVWLPVCVAGAVYGLVVGRHLDGVVIGLGAAFGIQLALMTLLLASYFSYTWVMSGVDALRGKRRAAATPLELPLLAAESARSGAEVFAGVVRADTLLRSPLTHSDCVAYRLVGRGPVGLIDEAAAISFQIELANGARVRVEPDPCTVNLSVPDAPRALRPSGELTRFLERRGAFPSRGPLHLAEALVVEGDRVVVEGESAEAMQNQGYRGRREQVVVRETRSTMLTIRRVDDAPTT